MSGPLNNRYQEENAKAEQIGAGVALGCVSLVALFVLVCVVIAIVG